MDVRVMLEQLRKMRIRQEQLAQRAADALNRATAGMGRRRATDRGGTGSCPLTDYAILYGDAIDDLEKAKSEADALWGELKALVAAVDDLDARLLVERFYNLAMPWPNVAKSIKRSQRSMIKLHAEAIRQMMQNENIC